MKRVGLLWALLTLASCTVFAQDNSSSTTTSGDGSTTNTTTTTTTGNTAPANSSATSTTSKEQDSDAHKAQAQSAETAADDHKQRAKAAGSSAEEARQKALARVDDSTKILNELLGASDKGIPQEVFQKAKCVAVVPSMVKGGFVFGAEHGKGIATCRTANGWSAPAFFTLSGGSWGLQIGAQAVDLVMLFMTDEGANIFSMRSSIWAPMLRLQPAQWAATPAQIRTGSLRREC